MRGIAVSAAALAAMMVASSAEAVEVQVDGFAFGCPTPDGEVRKPRFGDVDGAYFTDLPAERKPCLETVDRMIYSCSANTIFISQDLNDRFPDCLEVFERQAKWCVRHFEEQRHKCDAGGSSTPAGSPALDSGRWQQIQSALRADGFDPGPVDGMFGPKTRQAIEAWQSANGHASDGELTTAQVEELLELAPPPPPEPFGPDWLIADNQPCQLWNGGWMSGDAVNWWGSCVDGKASGEGRAVWHGTFGHTYEGSMQAGKAHGYGTHDLSGSRYEGEFRDGVRWGEGIEVWADGARYEGGWRDDAMHGQGTWTDADGRYVGGFRDGEKHGRGTYTTASETYEMCDGSIVKVCPSAEQGPLQGSIAFSQEADGGYAWGIAWSFDSRSGALAESIDQCQAHGGSDCAEVGWFSEACGALAIGDGNGYGAGWGDTTAEAERDALSQCQAANPNCRIEVARCSQSQDAGGQGRRPREDTVAADTPAGEEPAQVVLEPKCADEGPYWDCWAQLSHDAECYAFVRENGFTLLNHDIAVLSERHAREGRGMPAHWSGACPDGAADGEGTLTGTEEPFVDVIGERFQAFRASGAFADGVLAGPWVIVTTVDFFRADYSDDRHEFHMEGVYADGLLDGDWISILRGSDGSRCSRYRFSEGANISSGVC